MQPRAAAKTASELRSTMTRLAHWCSVVTGVAPAFRLGLSYDLCMPKMLCRAVELPLGSYVLLLLGDMHRICCCAQTVQNYLRIA